jgi:hypothetical protein
MDVSVLARQFGRVGARVKVRPSGGRRGFSNIQGTVAINIDRDRDGEFFEFQVQPGSNPLVEAVQIQPDIRHLLLMTRDSERGEKHKFLCGHDERAWFVAAVPEVPGIANVAAAMEALKPGLVRQRQNNLRIRPKNRNRRRNDAFIRQGEWFFIPSPNLNVDPKLVLQNEPLRRGRGKPHAVEFLYRVGGETVYVSNRYPNGLTATQYGKLLSRKPEARNWQWSVLRRNPQVYVRGRVRHSDHKTIELNGWHQVLMNTETQAAAMRHLAFVD